jgi:protein-S-isoprenylcysteine O-methyltransferase Ste14
MALLHSFESSGNTLFKYRGQIPLILFVLAVPCIYFTDYSFLATHPKVAEPLKWFAIGLSVLGFVFRAWAIGTTPAGTSGRNTKEQVAEVLNSTGIYSIVRHPLYVGNYFMWIGIVAYVFNPWFVIVVSLMYWLYYERIMFAEERFLERKFGQDYLDWSLKAPAFIPAFGKYITSATKFSLRTVLRREYSGVLATVLGFVFVDITRDFFLSLDAEIPFVFNMAYAWVVGSTVVYVLIFRSLKHYTRILHRDDRT